MRRKERRKGNEKKGKKARTVYVLLPKMSFKHLNLQIDFVFASREAEKQTREQFCI